MLDTQALIARIDSSLRCELPSKLTQPGAILSITLPVQELHLRALPTMKMDWLFWRRPNQDETILGLGTTIRCSASGQDRFDTLSRKLQDICSDWCWIDPELTGVKPLSYLCFAFSPDDQMCGPWGGLPNSELIIPELILQQTDDRCVATFSAAQGEHADRESIRSRWMGLFSELLAALNQAHTPPGCKTILTMITTSSDRKQWRKLVTEAQDSISAGGMEKVVIARHQRVQAQRRLGPAHLMATLNYLYPNSILIAHQIGERLFVAATPEKLLNQHNGNITCDAVAGTTRRSAVEQTDEELGSLLLSDPKTRHEHQLVVDGIKTSLETLCVDLECQRQPSLIRLRNLQHLSTEITGRLQPDIGLLQVAAKLHPTAAVNGHPSAQANLWLKQHEPFARGWYSGAAGWIDCQGDGELAVLLRCALLDRDQADLFAGAGITAGSDADAEYDETELKFSVMLEALENA